MYSTGIDQHRRSSVLTTFAADGRIVGHVRLANDRRQLSDYFAQFPGPHQAVVEATGRWYWLRDLLIPAGVDLRLAHAKFLKAIAYAMVKTDAIDATTLGQLLRTGFLPEAHMISEALRGPRDVLRTRLRLVQRCVGAQGSVDRLLEKFNVDTVAVLPSLYQAQAGMHAAQIALLRDQIRQLEQLVRPTLLVTPEIQRLLWIPGIGRLTAFTIYLDLDGIARFPTGRQFWSYCRLVPAQPIPPAGAATAPEARRGPLPQAGLHARRRPAVQYFPEIRAWYQRWKRKKPVKVARTLVSERTRQERLHRPARASGLQPAVQRDAALAAQTGTVAPPGEPPPA